MNPGDEGASRRARAASFEISKWINFIDPRGPRARAPERRLSNATRERRDSINSIARARAAGNGRDAGSIYRGGWGRRVDLTNSRYAPVKCTRKSSRTEWSDARAKFLLSPPKSLKLRSETRPRSARAYRRFLLPFPYSPEPRRHNPEILEETRKIMAKLELIASGGTVDLR